MPDAFSTPWRCPSCLGTLDVAPENLQCGPCQATYPVVHGIPDLRVHKDSWVDLDDDRARARDIGDRIDAEGLEASILHIFLSSRGMTEKQASYRTRQVLAGVEKCQSQCSDWLRPVIQAKGYVLEIGCGPGQMLAAAATQGCEVMGVDVSMEWLVIARHLVERHGGKPKLAAGFAERLPLADNSVAAVVSLDVIEHVGDQEAYVSELQRVLEPGGFFGLSTPNRYSLSPEPHVNVWGVGYVPRSFQARYVRLMSDKSYAFTRLLSVRETRHLFSGQNGFEADVVFPGIPEHELAGFSKAKKRLALAYNRLVNVSLVKLFLPFFGAYYRIIGNVRR